jgi:hypothetical protein
VKPSNLLFALLTAAIGQASACDAPARGEGFDEGLAANEIHQGMRDAAGRACADSRSDLRDCGERERRALGARRAQFEARKQQQESAYAECERQRIAAGNLRPEEHLQQAAAADRVAADAGHPNISPMLAKGAGEVPGALICPDYQTAQVMFDWYSAHKMDELEDSVTGGRSRARRQPFSAPVLRRYGCTLVVPGTPLALERGNAYPVVSAKLPNGQRVRGITFPSMMQDPSK